MKRVVLLIAVFLLVISFAACSDDDAGTILEGTWRSEAIDMGGPVGYADALLNGQNFQFLMYITNMGPSFLAMGERGTMTLDLTSNPSNMIMTTSQAFESTNMGGSGLWEPETGVSTNTFNLNGDTLVVNPGTGDEMILFRQ